MPIFDPSPMNPAPPVAQTGPSSDGIPPPQITSEAQQEIMRRLDNGADLSSLKKIGTHEDHVKALIAHYSNYTPQDIKIAMTRMLKTPEGEKVARDTVKQFPEIFGDHDSNYTKKA